MMTKIVPELIVKRVMTIGEKVVLKKESKPMKYEFSDFYPKDWMPP